MARRPTALPATCGLVALLASLAGSAAAQAPVVRVVGDPDDVEGWAAALVELGAADVASLEPRAPVHERARVLALHRVEVMVGEARQAAARLDEARALALLADARQRVEALADLPGSSEWLAEVELTLGIAAAQAGLHPIAEESFGRAASLNPDRVIAAAEASPPIVRQARAAIAAERQRAFGVVSVAGPAGARVFVDDRAEGRAPVEVRVRAGRHVLRVEAAGHRAWGGAIDVLPGPSPAFSVALSRMPQERARVLLSAQTEFDPGALSVRATELGRRVLWVETATERAMVIACDRPGCGAPVRWRRGRALGELGPVLPHARVRSRHRLARAWMTEPTRRRRGGSDPAGRPWWRRWPVWVGVGAAVAAGAVGAGVALRPDPEQRLHVLVDPSEL